MVLRHRYPSANLDHDLEQGTGLNHEFARSARASAVSDPQLAKLAPYVKQLMQLPKDLALRRTLRLMEGQ